MSTPTTKEEVISFEFYQNISDCGWTYIIDSIRLTPSGFLMSRVINYIDTVCDRILKLIEEEKSFMLQKKSKLALETQKVLFETMKWLRVIHEIQTIYYEVSGDKNLYKETVQMDDKKAVKYSVSLNEKQLKFEEMSKIEGIVHQVKAMETITILSLNNKDCYCDVSRSKVNEPTKLSKEESPEDTIKRLLDENEALRKAMECFQLALIDKDEETRELKQGMKKEMEQLKSTKVEKKIVQVVLNQSTSQPPTNPMKRSVPYNPMRPGSHTSELYQSQQQTQQIVQQEIPVEVNTEELNQLKEENKKLKEQNEQHIKTIEKIRSSVYTQLIKSNLPKNVYFQFEEESRIEIFGLDVPKIKDKSIQLPIVKCNEFTNDLEIRFFEFDMDSMDSKSSLEKEGSELVVGSFLKTIIKRLIDTPK